MTILITGGAGFIGSNLVNKLLSLQKKILVVDNFLMGNLIKVEHPNLCIIKANISNYYEFLEKIDKQKHISKFEEVFHLAANSDILKGVKDINVDYENTLNTTINSLKISKKFNIPNFYFASSSAIYGDLGKNIKEDAGPLLPISNYGAMKLASEAVISAARESFLKNAIIFRFPNVVGPPASHGVIYDFVEKLKNNNTLDVMGNGFQQKVYLHVEDLIEAIFFIIKKTQNSVKCNIFNIGPDDDGITVKEIAENVVLNINAKAKIKYGNEDRGWMGDVPKFSYDTTKLKMLGWKRKLSSRDAVLLAIKQIIKEK